MAAVKDNLARKQIFIPANVPKEEIVLRVAAYCRVSTDSDDQINSFTAQNSHYMEMITAHDRWELVDIYVTTFTPTTPFQSGQGVKKDHPLKEGDNRLPCYGNARFSKEPRLFYQNVT